MRAGAHLGYCDTALLGQLLFGFLAGVGVAEVRVEILVQNLRRLFTEVTPFSPETTQKKESDALTSL